MNEKARGMCVVCSWGRLRERGRPRLHTSASEWGAQMLFDRLVNKCYTRQYRVEV
ncbi:WGR domain-containing protein [Brucella pituitosa]|uniref:WGR domain-containing protein n=1 Tax=Brucella pituitosa TaxID=571256 RepID=UPI003D7E0E91